MKKPLYITAFATALLACSCATQRYVRSDVVRTFAPSVAPDEVTVYKNMREVPSTVLLIGETEARSIKHNNRDHVELMIRTETADNGGNGVFIVYNEPSFWTTTLNTGHGVMMLVADTVRSNGGKNVGEQFVDFLNERRAQAVLPPNIFFASAGRDLWWHKLTMPDGNRISPSGLDLTLGYDRSVGNNDLCLGVVAASHRTRFNYNDESCGIDVVDIIPRMALRYRTEKRFAWAADAGVGYSFCKKRLTAANRVNLNGLAYTVGLECGYMITRYTVLAIGFDVLGEIYEQGEQRLQRFNLRAGLNFMF